MAPKLGGLSTATSIRVKFLQLLLMGLAFAYPAYKNYKAIQKRDDERADFWGKYWIIFAFFVCLEFFVDLALGWLPLYYEAKVLFVVALWLPKTRLAEHIYDRVMEPLLKEHEQTIDRFMMDFQTKSYDLFHSNRERAGVLAKDYWGRIQSSMKEVVANLEKKQHAARAKKNDPKLNEVKEKEKEPVPSPVKPSPMEVGRDGKDL